MDILKYKPVRILFFSKYYPFVAQAIFFICFVALIYGGIVVPDVDPNLVNTLRNTNFASLVVWSLWWPLIILSAVFLGRFWCQVCPMELLNSLLSRIGLKRKAPLFFKSGWLISLFYTLILVVIIHTFWAHRYPRRMALYLLLLFAVTIAMGLVYEKRAFCNYVCPVGHLLGLYALCSPLEWRAGSPEICHQCQTKDCISPNNYYTLLKRSCTSNLYPAAIKDNRRCLLCTQCFKVCPYGNLRFSVRKPLADFFRHLKINTAEFFFIFVVSSFVIHEIYVEWPKAQDFLYALPAKISAFLGISGELAYFLRGIILFLLLPAFIFLIPSVLARIWGKMSLSDAARKFAVFILPTMAAAHVMKSFFKITSRIPYYRYFGDDPLGLNTAKLIVSGEVQLDKNFIDAISPFLAVMALVLFAGALVFSSLLLVKTSK